MPTFIDSVSPRHLAALVRHLEHEGLACTAALRRAGVSRQMLDWDRIPIPAALAAMQEIVKGTKRTDLGFVRGLITQAGPDHVASRLLLSAPTLREGLRALAPYMPLISPAIRMHCRDEPHAFVIELGLARPLPYEIGVIALETVAVSSHRQWLFLLQARALHYEIAFSWPAPAHAARYRELRSPRVSFGSGTTPAVRMRMPAEVAKRPLPMADEKALRDAARQARDLLAELARERSLSDWVRHVLTTVGEQLLGQEETAALLHISGKTLSRRLAQENARFGEMAQQVRQARAEDMLLNAGGMSIGDISHALGYSTPSNFVRSFKKRSGMTPAQFRAGGGQARRGTG
ncbi:MAG: AraC family transcriptional regulator ligand-binding domain-containing protein [Pseudomonadota bacterium]|nr:AraC family transcriptional regulator ligand-binding domain-containing protein [Pseudomonadota bacterium]